MSQVLGYCLLVLVVLFWMYREVQVYRVWRRRRRVQAEVRRLATHPPARPFTEFADITARKRALASAGVEVDELRVIVHVVPPPTAKSTIH